MLPLLCFFQREVTANDRGVLPLPSNCRLSEIKWYENDNRMTEDMVFTAGNTYSAEVVIYTMNLHTT